LKQLVLGAQYIYTGRGSLEALRDISTTRVFIATGGSSMLKSGIIAKIQGYFAAKQCETFVYSGIAKNPDIQAVLDGLAKMRQFAPDLVIAVGGGSPIDAAKVMTLLYEYPEITFDNILQVPLPTERRGIKFVAIPSTSGTGSEVTKAAVVTFKDQDLKIGLRTTYFIPDIAILDPDLTMTMPPDLVAETGMDAMTHAVECYLNKNADEFTTAMAVGAIEGILQYLPISYSEKTPESREKVHNYQCLAGIAFANSGLGMVHGIAHALGGKYNMGHGLLNAIALPYALQFDVKDAGVKGQLDRLARKVGKEDFISAIIELNKLLQIPVGLKAAGITAEQFADAFEQLVDNSLKGPTVGNPVPINREEMAGLLRRIFAGEL
jgi:alcohol dehydrogenase class IV